MASSDASSSTGQRTCTTRFYSHPFCPPHGQTVGPAGVEADSTSLGGWF